MLRSLLLTLLFAGFLFSQTKVQIQPRAHDWQQIGVDLAISTSAATTDSWNNKIVQGATTVWLDTVSTSSLGDLTVELKLYNSKTGKWGSYYSGNDLVTITVSSAEWPIYIILSDYDQWAWADKAELLITTASGSAVMDVYVGGW